VNLLVCTLVVPLVAAIVGSAARARRISETAMMGGLALTFVLCVATAGQFLQGRSPAAFGDALRVDGLSALVLVLCGFVGMLSGTYGVGYLRRNEARGLVTPRMRRECYGLIPAYVFAMLLVSVSNNLGLLWIAVELTTLASVFLITFHDRDTSLEAAWKFLMLGSLGLAFALLGTVLMFAAGQGPLGEGLSALDWTRFMQVAPDLHPFTLRLGVVFALIGYGTKAGLAPMHTWKPDAYREAPSPAGVLMAVGMMNGALYCILRIHAISGAALGPEFSGGLLLALGVLSVLMATPFILIQWNLKRLLAYSSIEHVGIMAVGVGLGVEAGLFGALLHMTYHSLAKPVAFFSAGTIAQLHRSSNFDRIGRGTFGRTPVASALFVLAALIITGSPPFGLFFSEMVILRAGLLGSHVGATSIFLAALVVLFCGFAYQVGQLVLGPQPDLPANVPDPEAFDLGMGTTVAAAVVAVVSAFYLPGPLLALIHAATQVVWRPLAL
jgi:hydrogenase-4 component F